MESIKKKKIALIGAGVFNLAFLNSIKQTDNISITMLERSKIISGRAATKTFENFSFDNGANYFNCTDSRLLSLIKGNENLVEINKWIYPFDKNNKIDFDDIKAEQHNLNKKYTFKNGISQLGKLLLETTSASDFQLYFSKNITKLVQLENLNWELYSNEENLGEYNYVVAGIPAPNLLRILKLSDFKANLSEAINSLENNTYKKIFSLQLLIGNQK
jgi:renalase